MIWTAMMTNRHRFMSTVSDIPSDFNPHRLRLARERRGLTKESLGQLCGVSRRAVTDWESGNVESPPVGRIADVLNFPASFFYGEDIDEVGEGAVSFRALSSMTPRQVRRVLTHASLVRSFSSWIDKRYATPPVDVPSIEELTASVYEAEPSPVEAADSVRAIWTLGVKPVRDMLALVESRGVRVFGLPATDREVDAFSFWFEDRPFVFLNASKSAERVRFDLAHELGHLCMHRNVRTNRARRFELDANAFASAFLMPKAGLLSQIVGKLSLGDVMSLKKFWRVSATAMVRRLHQLGRITDWQYRSWMIELSGKGFRSSEPDGQAHEQSALLRQVLGLAREDGWRVDRISKELGIPRSDLSEALIGLTVTSVVAPTDAADPDHVDRTSARSSASLRLVQ
ncbi:XRE family transcriptional regulator [Dactylosporangium roseum]|uniref:XRE family transcriptional regulator n=1 Tax=Dactylosporangium roseum TaxID=47989 RepID=A0ABY5Z4T1_9ACTN|nr:XRE family transcriptional regulator [Dactylosporangium roseum]UWZ35748.1 XRE family transcriptional regulator [Dactylosporangium roseum]